MDNNDLIKRIESEVYHPFSTYSTISPSEETLDAMRRVNRKLFLPEQQQAFGLLYGHQVSQIWGAINSRESFSDKEILDIIRASFQKVIGPLGMSLRDIAYNDIPIDIGQEQTCSQPSMNRFLVDCLQVEEGMKILDIGGGSGYFAAILAEKTGPSGKVYSIEYIPELAEFEKQNLESHFGENYKDRVEVIQGDGSIGLPENAPYDRIVLTAQVDLEKFNPKILEEQLSSNGILLYPVNDKSLQRQKYKDNHPITEGFLEGQIGFVPLVGENS